MKTNKEQLAEQGICYKAEIYGLKRKNAVLEKALELATDQALDLVRVQDEVEAYIQENNNGYCMEINLEDGINYFIQQAEKELGDKEQ